MRMTLKELRAAIALGEDSTRQFKVDIRNADSPISGDGLIEWMAAHPNASTEELPRTQSISKRAVLKWIAVFKEEGRIRRVSPPRGGHWEFPDSKENGLNR